MFYVQLFPKTLNLKEFTNTRASRMQLKECNFNRDLNDIH